MICGKKRFRERGEALRPTTDLTTRVSGADREELHLQIFTGGGARPRRREILEMSSVVPSTISAAERDPELAEIQSRNQTGHTAPLQEIIVRAARKGETPTGADSSTLIAELLGPLFHRRWFSREPLDEEFVKAVARTSAARRDR